MFELPTGTVTFLFTDVEGSTRLLAELGPGYAHALAEHRRAVRGAVARHGGVEVDTQGDAFFCAFSSALEAVAAAGEAQASHCRFGWEQLGFRFRQLLAAAHAMGLEGAVAEALSID